MQSPDYSTPVGSEPADENIVEPENNQTSEEPPSEIPIVTKVEIEAGEDDDEIIEVIVPSDDPILPIFKSAEQVLQEAEEEAIELAKLPVTDTAPAGDLNILFEKDMADPAKETQTSIAAKEPVASIFCASRSIFQIGQ